MSPTDPRRHRHDSSLPTGLTFNRTIRLSGLSPDHNASTHRLFHPSLPRPNDSQVTATHLLDGIMRNPDGITALRAACRPDEPVRSDLIIPSVVGRGQENPRCPNILPCIGTVLYGLETLAGLHPSLFFSHAAPAFASSPATATGADNGTKCTARPKREGASLHRIALRGRYATYWHVPSPTRAGFPSIRQTTRAPANFRPPAAASPATTTGRACPSYTRCVIWNAPFNIN